MIAELSPPQREAVSTIDGPLLVFAGAGSGKTRVITFRIANLIAQGNAPPSTILAITFTNKAAGEMKRRLETLLGPGLSSEVWVGTFHATCAKLLRMFGDRIGLSRNFLIYDSDDQKRLVTQIARDLELDEKRFPPRALLARIHKEKQEGRGPDEMSLDDYLANTVVKVYREYEKRLAAASALDFEDLIGKMVRLLEDNELGSAIRRRFHYVLVDEFQDTNRMQYRLVKAFAKEHRNVCVVGDDDQSIYRWRGADVRNIRGFHKDFPEATVVKLEENYRSTKHIVDAALAVIARSSERVPKNLFTNNDEGNPIDLIATASEHQEAAAVVTAVAAARAEGISLSEIAVFYRVHAQSRVLEDALRIARVPYQIVGGMRFYERAEIKDALSYLRLISNSKSDVDFGRVVNTPARGIGNTTIERIYRFASNEGLSMFESLFYLDRASEVQGAAKKKLIQFRELISDLQTDASTMAPSEVLENVLSKTGYREGLNVENSADSTTRMENLQELLGSIRDFEEEMRAAGEVPTVDLFLERTALAGVDDHTVPDKLSMMTVHAAKGLEFDWVILTGMEEEMFPYRGLERGGEEELEEERRLAYVAITRAKKRLLMTYASRRQIFGTTRFTKPSRFVMDLPAQSLVHRSFGPQAASYDSYSRDRSMFERDDEPNYDDFVDRDRYDDSPIPSRAMPRVPASVPPPSARFPRQSAAPRPSSSSSDEGRYVDRSFFSDDSGDSNPAANLRKGSRVAHDRFGEGEVLKVVSIGEPAVVAFFPGWGEKKVLLRFLKLA